MAAPTVSELTAAGVTVPAVVASSGRPLDYLHVFQGLQPDAPVHRLLAEKFRLIAPELPGFGVQPFPKGWNRIEDLAYFVLDLVDQLHLDDAVLVGASFGGWVAMEAAVRSSRRFGALVLVDALGMKFVGRDERDIADLHGMVEQDAKALLWHEVPAEPDYAALPEDRVTAMVRSYETFTRLGWKPYMFDPAMQRWAHRVTLPALALWGEHDRFVTPDYGRNYARALPDAKFATVPGAGHFPLIEQPEAAVRSIVEFTGG